MSAPRWDGGLNALGLTELEVWSGVVHDTMERWPALDHTYKRPREALAEVMRPLLERPPVVVGFSGGRDSSALLAIATIVARREGLDPPVAVTLEWPGNSSTDELHWQEVVLGALKISSWERLRPGSDLDLVGPMAVDSMRLHGLLWPAPAFALRPLLRAAAGGTLVTGEGGDQVFGDWALANVRSALLHRRPNRRHFLELGSHLPPRRLRYIAAHHGQRPYQSWLQPVAWEAERVAAAAEVAVAPITWPAHLAQQASSRSLNLTIRSLKMLAATEGASYEAPFVDRRFLSALAQHGGPLGLGDRTDVMTKMFGDLLPAALLTRGTKATFGDVFWGAASLQFADAWSGAGPPDHWVRTEDLRRSWHRRPAFYGAALPLQAAWLTDHRDP